MPAAGESVYRVWRAALKGENLRADQHLPTGLGGVDGHPQPGLYRKREGGGWDNGVRQPVSWLPVKIMLLRDPADPASVSHVWAEGLHLKAILGRDTEVDAVKIWNWCLTRDKAGREVAVNAISQDDYKNWIEHGRWRDDAPAMPQESRPEPARASGAAISVEAEAGPSAAPAGLGHNSSDDADGYEALKALIEQHTWAVAEWLVTQPDGKLAADKAANWLSDVREIKGRVSEACAIAYAPIQKLEDEYRATWGGIAKSVESLRKSLADTVTAIGAREQARLQAMAEAEAEKQRAALRAKAEAERAEALRRREEEIARREAEQAARVADGIADMPLFEEAIPPPPPPIAEPIVVVEQVKVNFGGSTGRRVALKAKKGAVIEDWAAAAAHYSGADRLRAVIQALADADARNGVAHSFMKISSTSVAA